MALLGNRSILQKLPMRYLGGSVSTAGAVAVLRGNFNQHGMMRNAYEQFDPKSAIPNGHLSPSAWVLPKKAGGMSSRNAIRGAATLAGNGNLGLPAAASLSGSGDLTQALLGLVVSAVANLSGSGSLTAGMVGKLEAAATLAGSGNLTGAAGALAWMLAELSGSGDVAAVPYATGSASANIKGYGDLTPEGVRDAVWSAVLAQYPTTGTAGKALAAASSGGVDYAALGEAVWAALQADQNVAGSMAELLKQVPDNVWAKTLP